MKGGVGGLRLRRPRSPCAAGIWALPCRMRSECTDTGTKGGGRPRGRVEAPGRGCGPQRAAPPPWETPRTVGRSGSLGPMSARRSGTLRGPGWAGRGNRQRVMGLSLSMDRPVVSPLRPALVYSVQPRQPDRGDFVQRGHRRLDRRRAGACLPSSRTGCTPRTWKTNAGDGGGHARRTGVGADADPGELPDASDQRRSGHLSWPHGRGRLSGRGGTSRPC